MAFNTTNSPRFYSSSNPSQPNRSSLLRTTKVWYLTQWQNNCLLTKFGLLSLPPPPPPMGSSRGSPYQNLKANPCFLLSSIDLPIAKLVFWLVAHSASDLSAPNFKKRSQFQRTWRTCILLSWESGWDVWDWFLPR